jgi:hypothetical protein
VVEIMKIKDCLKATCQHRNGSETLHAQLEAFPISPHRLYERARNKKGNVRRKVKQKEEVGESHAMPAKV